MAVQERSKIYEILLFSFQYFAVGTLLLFLLASQQMEYYILLFLLCWILIFFSVMATVFGILLIRKAGIK